MKLALFIPALAALGLSACVTGYGYSDDGYYYGRQPASTSSYYGGVGYGTNGWRYGYGMGYGSPGYYGYYDPYSGYYYDPYYGYYFRRPPIVIIQRPPGDHHDHGGHDHDGDGHDGHDHHGHPPPWRDLDNLGNNGPHPPPTPMRPRADPPRALAPAFPGQNDSARRPERMRMAEPTPPAPRLRREDLPSRDR